MKRLSPFLAQCDDDSWGEEYRGAYFHWCPGCQQLHSYFVHKPWVNGAKWTFNGDSNAPEFHPSMNIVGRCHYFVRRGNGRNGEDASRAYINFCGDSKHSLSGQTVLLPPIPEGML